MNRFEQYMTLASKATNIPYHVKDSRLYTNNPNISASPSHSIRTLLKVDQTTRQRRMNLLRSRMTSGAIDSVINCNGIS